MRAIRLIVALAVAGTAIDASALDPACYKNHYILSVHCPSEAVHHSIGKVGAVAADAQGNVYFSAPHVVLRLNPDGTLTRIAGGYEPGDDGDGGPAVLAHLDIPYDDYAEIREFPSEYPFLFGALAVDREGNLFIADSYNNRVRRVDGSGTITTVVGDAGWPMGVGVDATGNLYVTAAYGSLNRHSPDGMRTNLVWGYCGDRFRDPGLCLPGQIAVDDAGNVYVPDIYCRVRKVSPDGSVATIAGNEQANLPGFTCGHVADTRPALGASLGHISAVALDASGNLYFADTGNHCIRKVDTAGDIETIAGACGHEGFAGDGGPASDARFASPSGIAVDAAGNVYVADTENQRVRRIGPDGIVVTVAGNGGVTTKLLLRRD